jgi:predicted outer membrane lipoprotein
MIAALISVAAVAVERFINRRRLRLREVLSDVGWLTLIFTAVEFAYLMFVEAFTLNYGAAARPLWYTEWPALKGLLLDAAVGVLLILTAVWLESAGLELRRPRLSAGRRRKPDADKCGIKWHEAA